MTATAVSLMGIPVHHCDLEMVLDAVDGFVHTGRRVGRTHQIVTVNTDFLVQARRHEDVHAILRSADLAIADGMPIVWASAALGQPLPERVAGADLVPALAERAALVGYRMLFFGGADGVAEAAARKLRAQHPDLQIDVATGDVSPTGDTDQVTLDEIRSYEADIICVALGHPKQERWIRRHAAELGIPVAIGVGGTFDFLAGERRRAAPWIQRSGLEWLHRLLQEPGRLTQRYATDIAVYVPTMALQVTRSRVLYRRPSGKPPRTRPVDAFQVVSSNAKTVVVALQEQRPIDHQAASELTMLAIQTRAEGRELRLIAPGAQAVRSLQKLRMDRLVALLPAPIARRHPGVGRTEGPTVPTGADERQSREPAPLRGVAS